MTTPGPSSLFTRERRECICPTGMRSGGRLYGVSFGPTLCRLSTKKGCPEHDQCHQWTAENRAKYVIGREGWTTPRSPYCPIHATKDCP